MKQAFTLIELLVVVLIIGILSAIALPQYQKAVMRTRVMGLLPLLRAIDLAEERYLLANGTYTLNLDELDIDMPTDAERINESTVKRANSYTCYLRTGGEHPALYSAYCNSLVRNAPSVEKYFSGKRFVCWGGIANTDSYRLCQSISGHSTPDVERSNGFYFY